MKKLSFFLLAICITTISCSKDESTREEEQARLDKMYQEIIDYSQINSKSCTNPEEWTFMKYSPSNCSGYIIYNKAVDADIFRKKIDQYREAQGKFDAKWGVYYTSVCPVRPAPTSIECIDGKPSLIYSFVTHQ
ncbi:hypothetical protein [Flavobacterium quisquiliarum]|uniref:Uncharacterized protein n=1 Tax=Flavobacterium quisquiliarum TaxID=1834436 RepID=A0ABV8W6M1_9FLAO|nr:hypothetical protein [Flavobacterium quisquiliarum]MBW1656292.1 hypothetical protein [Flavobacterium quisquiliarum]NWL04042.1 hypothetical protein [Flavobacterium collinsii]